MCNCESPFSIIYMLLKFLFDTFFWEWEDIYYGINVCVLKYGFSFLVTWAKRNKYVMTSIFKRLVVIILSFWFDVTLVLTILFLLVCRFWWVLRQETRASMNHFTERVRERENLGGECWNENLKWRPRAVEMKEWYIHLVRL